MDYTAYALFLIIHEIKGAYGSVFTQSASESVFRRITYQIFFYKAQVIFQYYKWFFKFLKVVSVIVKLVILNKIPKCLLTMVF